MKRRSLALFLCMMMVLGTVAHAAPEGSAPGESAPADTGWEGDSTLTMTMQEGYEDLDAEATAPSEGETTEDPLGVVYDLYLVAEAQDVPGYNAYTYDKEHLEAGFAALEEVFPDMETVSDDAWRALAWAAGALVLDPGTEDTEASLKSGVTPAATNLPVDFVSVGETPGADKAASGLQPGLYLVIAHGNGMEPKDYIVPATDKVEGHVGTIAHSADYEYFFQPELVSLPGQQIGEDGEFHGEWNHNVTAKLKPERELRFGQVTLQKTINRYELYEPATFVFKVTAEKGGETVYENVVGLTFSAETGTKQTVTLDRIPLGATVTAEEIYSGAFYDAGTVTTEPQELTLDGLVLEFENTRGDDEKRGHGFVNEFTFNGTEWDLKQNGQAPAGGEEG